MLRFFYAIYLIFIAAPLFVLYTILTATVVIVGCLCGREKFFAYYPGMWWSRVACCLALCPVKIKGREHLDSKQSYVFVANHQGAFDIFLIYGYLGYPIKWMMKIGLSKIPFVGRACRSAGFIFVDNSTPKKARESIKIAEKRLQNGASLAVFPEGSRTYDGKMIRFQKGAFQVAVDQKLPIVPITLNGPYDVMPIHAKWISPHRMEMIIHPPIPPVNFIEEGCPINLRDLADNTQKIVASALWDKYR